MKGELRMEQKGIDSFLKLWLKCEMLRIDQVRLYQFPSGAGSSVIKFVSITVAATLGF